MNTQLNKYQQNRYGNTRYKYRARKGGYLKKTKGGYFKQLVDGQKNPYIKAGITSIPYLIKSVGLLKSLVNSEYKYIDSGTVGITFNNTGTVSYLTDVAQGLGDEDRIGNTILLKDIIFRCEIAMNATASATSVRVILFCDKETDGTSPTVTQVLETASYLSPLNQDSSKRFVVLHDIGFSMSIYNNRIISDKFYKELNIHTRYDGSGATVADARQNQIFLLTISNEVTNVPTINYNSRIKFYDS